MKRKYRPDTCGIEGCPNVHYAREWCRTHYDRWRNYGDPSAGPTIYFRSYRKEILAALDADGGWLTAAGIQLLLPNLKERQIADACKSATERGLLATRRVELAGMGRAKGKRGLDVRDEWRIL